MRPGDTLEPLVIESVGAGPMKTMAAILRDPTPMHYDPAALRDQGPREGPVNQGVMNIGYLVELLCRRAGGPRAVRRVRVRLLDNVFAGERVECTGTVVAVNAATGEAELELTATADGRVVLTGSAVVAAVPLG